MDLLAAQALDRVTTPDGAAAALTELEAFLARGAAELRLGDATDGQFDAVSSQETKVSAVAMVTSCEERARETKRVLTGSV